MNILLVTTCLNIGGAEKIVISLADNLANKGHVVKIVYLKGEVILKPDDSNIELCYLGLESPYKLFSSLIRLYNLIKSFKPDVVHSHLLHANILCRLLRIFCPISRLITSAHNSNEEGRLRMFAYQLTDRLTDISTNVSHEAVAAFVQQRAVPDGRMLCVYNGIDTDRFSYQNTSRYSLNDELCIPEGDKVILAVGRLNEAKDYPNLLNAFSRVNVKNVTLLIVGDGILKPDLETLTENLSLSDKVKFLGIRHDIPELMSFADVFVLSSAWEGFGLVVAEAMACERVVVATDCGGVREVVGECGYLVPPQDSELLANSISLALNLSDDERFKLGSAARSRVVTKYSLEASVNKYLTLYSSPNERFYQVLKDD
ncbi:glycosyltransferase [Vibrio diabolicus]|uniref:glycosyltransferase n=1 Tax=Vibrio diabolicus TaxID=50719 RepID=UPI00249472CA|nr:glycosyltransferase [Vibrio diabolicus]